MKTKKITISWMIILVMLFQIILPITSIAAEGTKTIVFNDGKLYSAIKDILGEEIEYNDTTKTIVISNETLGEITTLTLKNKGIEDVSGLENFTALKRLELSGNDLTADSNLDKLLNLEQIELIDLSTNKIDNLEAIKSIYESGKLIVTNQIINYLEIIKVDEEAQQTAANIGMPNILKHLEENEYNEFKIESNNNSLKPETFNVNTSKIKVGNIENETYSMFEGKLDVNTTVKSGEFKGSIINLTYVVIDKNSEGIMFKDENLYKAIKAQLTKNQTKNQDLKSYGEEGVTLYKAAYDEELILIIEKDILNNDITSLLLDNNQIKDLTGIEYFRALEELDLSKNYIEDVSKILDLQNSKAALRQEIVEKLNTLKSELATLNASLKTYDEQVKTNEKSVKAKQEAIAGIVAAYIRENNSDTISDATVKSIQETVNQITAEDINDNGECTKITDIDNASGINTKYGEQLRKDLLELKALLNKPNEINKEKEEKTKATKEKVEEFANAYSRAKELISIISDESMGLKFQDIDTNNMTTDEIKSNFAKLKELTLKEYNIIESKIEELTDEELEFFIGNTNKEEAKKEITNIKNSIDKMKESVQSINTLKGYLQNLVSAQKLINAIDLADTLSNLDDEQSLKYILTIAKRLENANTEKVVVKYLENLDLGYNNISNLETLKQIPGLKVLYLNHNLITDLSAMQNSELEKSIEVLNLANNDYIEDVSYLQNFTKLRGLSLAGNSISDISGLDYSKFEKLEVLNLSNNRVSDLKDIIKQLKKLEAFKDDDKSKANAKTANEKIAESFKINNQYITINVEIPQTDNKTATIELPKIFTQAEEFEPKEVYFENATLQQGIATVTVPTLELGQNKKVVSINGGIASGTTCAINYKVIKVVENVSLDKTELELKVNETAELKATVTPDDATNKNVIWASSNEEIVTVENGTVKAIAEGTATITVKTEDGNKTATCEITVEKIKLDKIEVKTNPTKLDYKLGEELDTQGLVLTATYTDGTKEEIVEGFTTNATTLNTEGTQEIVVSYTKDEITKETAFSVTVTKVVEEPENPQDPTEPEKLEVVTEYTVTEANDINYIEKINTKTDINNFKDNIVTNGNVRILSEGQEVTEGNIATGMTVEVSLNDEKVTYIAVVIGDCDGDGEADFSDILAINKHRLNKAQMEGEYLKAGDVTNDNVVDFSDILQINKYRLGKINSL